MSDTPAGTLGDLPDLAAAKHGDTAFLSDQPWLGYGEPVLDVAGFARAVHDYADRFWAAGIRSGDTVLVVQRNHIEVQALACALNRIGALPALLSIGIEPEEIVECAGRLEQPYLAARRRRGGTAGRTDRGAARADQADPVPHRGRKPGGPRRPLAAVLGRADRGPPGAPALAPRRGRLGGDHPHLRHHQRPQARRALDPSLYGVVRSQIAASRAFGQVGLSAKHLSFVHARTCSIVLAFLEVAMPILAIGDARPEHVSELMLEHRPDSLETHPNVFIRWEPVAEHPSRPFSPVQPVRQHLRRDPPAHRQGPAGRLGPARRATTSRPTARPRPAA